MRNIFVIVHVWHTISAHTKMSVLQKWFFLNKHVYYLPDGKPQRAPHDKDGVLDAFHYEMHI